MIQTASEIIKGDDTGLCELIDESFWEWWMRHGTLFSIQQNHDPVEIARLSFLAASLLQVELNRQVNLAKDD